MFDAVIFPETDVIARVISRLLYQFQNSPVMLSVLAALASEVQALEDAIYDAMDSRTIATAQGVNLDAIGRIVGQERELIDFDEFSWFTPDTTTQMVDQAPAWVANAPLGAAFIANDGFYKNLIEGKVYRNMTKYGSIPEIQNIVNVVFGINVSVVLSAPMTVILVVPDATSDNIIQFLGRVGNQPDVESVYYLPLPVGFFVLDVVRLSEYSPVPYAP